MNTVKWTNSKKGTIHALLFSWKTACGRELYPHQFDAGELEEVSDDAYLNEVTCPICLRHLTSKEGSSIYYDEFLRHGIMIVEGKGVPANALDIVMSGHLLSMFNSGSIHITSRKESKRIFHIHIVGPYYETRHFATIEADDYRQAIDAAQGIIIAILPEDKKEALLEEFIPG